MQLPTLQPVPWMRSNKQCTQHIHSYIITIHIHMQSTANRYSYLVVCRMSEFALLFDKWFCVYESCIPVVNHIVT